MEIPEGLYRKKPAILEPLLFLLIGKNTNIHRVFSELEQLITDLFIHVIRGDLFKDPLNFFESIYNINGLFVQAYRRVRWQMVIHIHYICICISIHCTYNSQRLKLSIMNKNLSIGTIYEP